MGLINLAVGCCIGFFCMFSCGFYCGGCIKCPCGRGNNNMAGLENEVCLNQNECEKVILNLIILKITDINL